MLVSDVINYANSGELRNISVEESDIISYINLAMVALYSRFRLASGEQIISLQDNISLYDVTSECMMIESVYSELGIEIPLNKDEDVYSIFTPSYDTLQVPNAKTGNQIAIMYLKNPPLVVSTSDVVKVPMSLLEPLLHYIGYRAHGSINGAINAENNTHLMRYEASCKRIEASGIIRRDVVPSMLKMKGFIDGK